MGLAAGLPEDLSYHTVFLSGLGSRCGRGEGAACEWIDCDLKVGGGDGAPWMVLEVEVQNRAEAGTLLLSFLGYYLDRTKQHSSNTLK